MSKGKRTVKVMTKIFLLALAILFCYPVIFLLVGSFMGGNELGENLRSALGEGAGYASWTILPLEPTLRHYIEVLLDSPEYFVMFWNSMKTAVSILAGQCLVSIPAAWGFAKFRFRFRKSLFFLYITLMMMPFQVTMLSNYLVLNKLNLMDTLWAIILPGIFSTFPVFIMFNFFRGIPTPLIEAARIDGADEIWIFFKIGIPLGKGGVFAAMVLGFLEYWNLIEQPMTFLKDKTKWPISLFLPNIDLDKVGMAFAVSVITLIPAVIVFFAGHDYLEQGIASIGIKE